MITAGRRTFSPFRRRPIALLVCLIAATSLLRAQDIVSPEYRVKAGFVYHFPEFVEWPAAVWDKRPSIELCVTTPHPFGGLLAELVGDERLVGRQVVLRELRGDDAIESCHVLYIARASSGILPRAARLPILTVSDSSGFLDAGGIVQLRTVENRVRFEISAAAAERVGLKLSSQLLRLAVAVREGRP